VPIDGEPGERGCVSGSASRLTHDLAIPCEAVLSSVARIADSAPGCVGARRRPRCDEPRPPAAPCIASSRAPRQRTEMQGPVGDGAKRRGSAASRIVPGFTATGASMPLTFGEGVGESR
jgi:hypothetical protein